MKKIISFIRKYDEMIVTVIVVCLAAVCLLSPSLLELSNTNLLSNGPIIKFFIAFTFAVLLVTLKWIIKRTIKKKRWKYNLFNIFWLIQCIILTSNFLLSTYYGFNIDSITLEIVSKVLACAGELAFLLKIFTIIMNRKKKNENTEFLTDNSNQTSDDTSID